ncbi:hypothetical protein KQI65_14810 [bacterium]|nr:hypothetical protein [bacterium]
MYTWILNAQQKFASDASDTEDVRLKKLAIFLVAGSCCIAGVAWTGMYYFAFGAGITAALPAIFVLVVGGAMVVSHVTKNHHYTVYTQIICIMYITLLISWSIGGVLDSGVVIIWALLGPICALMFLSNRQALVWFLLYLLSLVVFITFDEYFAMHGQSVTHGTRILFLLMNVGVSSVVLFSFAAYYVNKAIREQAIAHDLLHANLQQEIILRENERLATLGKLSAGVAHELNNPASAAQRGAEQLTTIVEKLENVEYRLGAAELSDWQLEKIVPHLERLKERAMQPLNLDPLERSDQEDEIERWLEKKGIKDAWELAPILVQASCNCDHLTELAKHFSDEHFGIVVAMLSHRFAARSVLAEIRYGANRISELVHALKSYSYLDQAPKKSVDVHEGLNSTLVMMQSSLKRGITVRRAYEENLPTIEAYGGELNQVWTNLIDNAISAMNGEGILTIRTSHDDVDLIVEIMDSGPGIPEDIRHRIFDPFFTTKAPGEGTGLGLNISYTIITQKHHGSLSVRSKPGETCFEIRLPLHAELASV